MKRFLILSALFVSLGHLPAAAAPRLNLLYITADDMNADSPGWMGNQLGATPALDAFAATCHRFINNHVTAPICQPSRSAMMTGRVPHRSGALGFHPIKPGTPTLTSVLKAAGYFTGVIDKHPHMKPDAEFPWDIKLSGSGKNPPLMREHMDQLLKAAADAKKPFFINANITDPHRPFPASADGDPADATAKRKKGGKKAQKTAAAAKEAAGFRVFKPEEVTVPSFLEDIPLVRKEVAQYFTAIARLDVTFKGILAALHESGRAEDTIMLFMSDHGMSFPFSKATVYFNGTRSPVLLRWPGMGATQRREEFVSSVDILPTLLDLLGVGHPKQLDGRSWLPLLRGEKQDGRDHVITHVNTVSSGKSFPQRCVRTKDWALMFHAWPDGTAHFRVEAMNGLSYNALAAAAQEDKRIAGRVGQFTTGTPLAFFNELTDRDERQNLIHEADYRAEINRLAALLLAHMEKTDDPQTTNFRKAMESWRASAAKQ
ncbi:MAG: sulfatase [Verrucomicrobia bacterium]|nr:sulfatase [Verrucomicrobiota bacterium]